MEASGPKRERETIIVFDEESDIATIWTASSTVFRRMLKRGWKPIADEERHAEFHVPRNRVLLPRVSKRKGNPNIAKGIVTPVGVSTPVFDE